MLRLSEQQIATLTDGARAEFRKRAAQHLRAHFSQLCARFESNDFDNFLRDQTARAERFGMTTELQLVKWFMLALLAGPEFDNNEEVSHFLKHPSFSPVERLDGLLDAVARASEARLHGR